MESGGPVEQLLLSRRLNHLSVSHTRHVYSTPRGACTVFTRSATMPRWVCRYPRPDQCLTRTWVDCEQADDRMTAEIKITSSTLTRLGAIRIPVLLSEKKADPMYVANGLVTVLCASSFSRFLRVPPQVAGGGSHTKRSESCGRQETV